MACSKLIEILPRGYGFVVLTGVATTCFSFYLAGKVVRARNEHKVPYPIMYDNDKPEFNCVQRAHQCFLETYPMNMFLLLTGGLINPIGSSIGGMIFLTGRAYSAIGYASGDPEKRKRGGIYVIGAIMMFGSTMCFAASCFGMKRCINFHRGIPFTRPTITPCLSINK